MILYGAGGHAKVVLEILEANKVKISSLYDDNPAIKSLLDYQVRSVFDFKDDQGSEFIVSIGCNRTRAKIVSKLSDFKFGTAIDPSAKVSPSAVIRKGTVVMPGTIINVASIIGDHCIINTGAVVEHDCRLGDFVHIAPNTTLCGEISVGEGTLIGAGAVVIPGVKIGSWANIGAGAVVLEDLPDGCTAVGNPAVIIRN